jgi:hypothetical protein
MWANLKESEMKAVRNMRNDWVVRSDIEFGENRIIRVTTCKTSSGALTTNASVQTIEPNGFMSHMMFQDFSKTLKASRVRATQAAVEAQHQEVMDTKDEIIARVKEFYATAEA